MFGQQNNQASAIEPASNDAVDTTAIEPVTSSSTPLPDLASSIPEPIATSSSSAATTTAPELQTSVIAATEPSVSSSPATTTSVSASGATDDDLVDIKKSALTELEPLVGHLDQTPEEKFHTTMMMIQAADNQTLIKEAYAAAQAISDEKARAQALLDVVNEINYFTQKPAT